MDELRGPTIQIVLHCKEGLGFGFLRAPFIISASLNGYKLETDPAIPSHAPIFDAELVWEADKRRFRNLRVQNVPIKVDVYASNTQGKKNKVGYMLLSLLSAQPCPSNKVVDVRHTWHRLLGVKSEGKCCHPQLLLSLTIEDRMSPVTPRNELHMFHSNEFAQFLSHPNTPSPNFRNFITVEEYIAESKKTPVSPELTPQLINEEGLIQLGNGQQMFILQFVIGAAENIDLLIPDNGNVSKDTNDFYINYSVFSHEIMTDRVTTINRGFRSTAVFNQRTSLRVRSRLDILSKYFVECPTVVIRLCAGEQHIGICSMDLRKLVPTENLDNFLNNFCNIKDGFAIQERCYLLNCLECGFKDGERKPYVDVEMTLKYIGNKTVTTRAPLSARSVTQLETGKQSDEVIQLSVKSESCTHLDNDGGYSNITANVNRTQTIAPSQASEIADLIKKMCESFAESQERLLNMKLKPTTSDMQVQCEPITEMCSAEVNTVNVEIGEQTEEKDGPREEMKTVESQTQIEQQQCESCSHLGEKLPTQKEMVKMMIPALEREALMQKYVEELEDWKEKQEELFKLQLSRKEQHHLEAISRAWQTRRSSLESRLERGVSQCRSLAEDLSNAVEEWRRRGGNNVARERQLFEAKKALELHYTSKFQELREASQRMEDDMVHQLRIKDGRIEELEQTVARLRNDIEDLKTQHMELKRKEDKYCGLTKEQTANLLQEMRCLEEKLENALQSKSFFKEQWARTVRELHREKTTSREKILESLKRDKYQLDLSLDELSGIVEPLTARNKDSELNKINEEYSKDFIADISSMKSQSFVGSQCIPDYMDFMSNELAEKAKHPLNEKLNALIAERESIVRSDNPDEITLQRLNVEIRTLLLSCGT